MHVGDSTNAGDPTRVLMRVGDSTRAGDTTSVLHVYTQPSAMSSQLKLESIEKLVKSEKPAPHATDDQKKAKERFQVTASVLGKLILKHWMGFSQCHLQNTMDVDLTLAHDLLVAMADHTIRLSPSIVTEACRQALVFTRTGKPLDTVLRTMWQHVVVKAMNKSSEGYQNLSETEEAVIRVGEVEIGRC